MPNATNTDSIVKEIILDAPRSRVWRALSTASEFGEWFGVKLDGPFAPGSHLRGQVTNKGYEHYQVEMWIEKVEPEHTFAYRWHPNAHDAGMDYSKEPTTLVVFTLDESGRGTHLTVVESGFDALPAARREKAFTGNTKGWESQMQRIKTHVDR